MQHRISRIVSAAVVAGALTGGLFVGTTVAWPAPLGTSDVNLSPPAVTVSNVPTSVNLGAFQLTAINTGTSNISQLYLIGTSNDPVYAYRVVSGAPADSCGTSTYDLDGTLAPLSCSFGALTPGASVTVLVALISPSSGTTWTPTFAWSTTGYVTGKNKSHGDAWPVNDLSVNLTSGNKDSAGTYVWDSSQPTVQTNQSVSKKNPQASILTIDGTVQDVALFVQDGSGVQPPGVSDTTSFDCSGLVSSGSWTQAYANDDQYSGLLHTTITVYHGPNANTVTGVCYVHKVYATDGTYTVVATPLYNAPESDGSLCSADPPAATDTLPCFTLTNDGPNLVIQLYSDTNGFAGTW